MSDEVFFDPSAKKKKKKKVVLDFLNLDEEISVKIADDGSKVLRDEKGKKEEVVDFIQGSDRDKCIADNKSEAIADEDAKAYQFDDLKTILQEAKCSTSPSCEQDQNMEEVPEFSTLKKKKKKVKFLDLEPFEDDEVVVAVKDDIFDDGGASYVQEETRVEVKVDPEPWIGSERDYTYDELLSRVFDTIHEKNPEILAGEKKKFIMKPPKIMRVGSKKTSLANFLEICRKLRRQPKHLQAFFLAELGTSGSVDGNNQLIIKGRFQQKQMESVLRNYIREYVTCHTCYSYETTLDKDTRLFFLQCHQCGSRCSVTTIKSGFQALTGKRAAARDRAT